MHGRFGNYVALPRGDLIREFHRIVGKPGRRDRISFQQFKDKRIIGQMETVYVDYERNPLSEDQQYSRVGKLVRVLPDKDW